MWNILSHASKNIILYQWTVLEDYIEELFRIENIKTNMSPYLCKDMWSVSCMNINNKSKNTPACTSQMLNNRLLGQNSVVGQWEQQTYPPTWRHKIYTKGGSKFSILFNSSWIHHVVSISNIISGTFKSDRIHQTSSGPFTWLLCHKPIFQIEITFHKNDIAHIQRCIIPIRIAF